MSLICHLVHVTCIYTVHLQFAIFVHSEQAEWIHHHLLRRLNLTSCNLCTYWASRVNSPHLGKMIERVSPFGVGLHSSIVAILLAANIAGFLGSARSIESLPSNTTTADIVGLSSGSSWTHKSAICKHFKTSAFGQHSINEGSTNSDPFPSFHSVHAYQLFK